MRNRSFGVLLSTCLATPLLCQNPNQYAGEWPLDGINPLVVTDLSGNGNDGTLNNFPSNPWVPGVFGNALAFDGIDDSVTTAQQNAPIYDGMGSPYSVSFWVKGPPQGNKFVYAEGATTSNNPIILFGSGLFVADQDKFRVLVRNDQGQVALQGISNTVAFDNGWHHVAFIDNAGECSCYIDGVLDTGSFSYDPAREPGLPGHGNYPLNTATMGALRRGNVCCHMTGEVDDLRLYRFAMTALDVQLAMLGVPLLPASASIGSYGAPCGSPPLSLLGSGSSQISGSGIVLDLVNGQPGTIGLLALGLGPIAAVDLTPLGYPGCTLYPANPAALFAGIFDPSGAVPSTVIPVPNNPALVMAQLNAQGVALANGTLEFSGAVIATIGN